MSECVVRMEMPQNCFDCILHCDGNFEDGNGYCRGISPYQDYDYRPMGEMRPLLCPILCQLPEGHGRLVDADAILNDKGNYFTFGGGGDRYYHETILEYSPTIVPAERSET